MNWTLVTEHCFEDEKHTRLCACVRPKVKGAEHIKTQPMLQVRRFPLLQRFASSVVSSAPQPLVADVSSAAELGHLSAAVPVLGLYWASPVSSSHGCPWGSGELPSGEQGAPAVVRH